MSKMVTADLVIISFSNEQNLQNNQNHSYCYILNIIYHLYLIFTFDLLGLLRRVSTNDFVRTCSSSLSIRVPERMTLELSAPLINAVLEDILFILCWKNFLKSNFSVKFLLIGLKWASQFLKTPEELEMIIGEYKWFFFTEKHCLVLKY